MEVRPVRAHEGVALRAVRLASLRADPAAFGSTYERDAARPAAFWDEAAAASAAGTRQRSFVVIGDDGPWLGLTLVRHDDEHPGDAVINATWVAPAARGRGLGRALCAACLAWAIERGFERVRVQAFAGNEAALATYEAAGFAAPGRGDELADGRIVRELVWSAR